MLLFFYGRNCEMLIDKTYYFNFFKKLLKLTCFASYSMDMSSEEIQRIFRLSRRCTQIIPYQFRRRKNLRSRVVSHNLQTRPQLDLGYIWTFGQSWSLRHHWMHRQLWINECFRKTKVANRIRLHGFPGDLRPLRENTWTIGNVCCSADRQSI